MIDKIKAELERRKSHCEQIVRMSYNSTEALAKIEVFDSLLAFIESIEKEHEESCDDIVFHAISKVCDTDKPETFARHNETVYKVAKMAVEMARDEAMEKEQDVDLEKEIKHMVECEREYMNFQVKGQLISYMARHFYKLGLDAKENTSKIKGWVARDEDGDLNLFSREPYRSVVDSCNYWAEQDGAIRIDKNLFPNLKWKDEPIKVELEINRL